ncbi:MAG: secretion system X translation initiation factor [Bacteroidota bacterium]
MKPWPLIRQRRWLFLPGLALVLLAAYWLWQGRFAAAPAQPPAVAQRPAPPGPPLEAVAGSAGQAPVAAAAPVGVAAGPVDIFAVRTWEPPPPPVDTSTVAAPPPPPPPPQAPPLPFRYLGKLEESGQAPVFFLARDDRVLAVHPGQVIDRDYRVGRYAGGQLGFLYRPMKIQQFLPVGDKP